MLVAADFRPAWWLTNPHAQTIYAAMLRPTPVVAVRRERIELGDGDFLDVDWTTNDDRLRPLVLVIHGLEGGIRSNYVLGMLTAVVSNGWQGAVLHFRGCSGTPNRLARGYHSGETGDLGHVLDLLHERWPQRPIAVVGYSLGGNVLLKYLGEQGSRGRVDAAVAVSVPFMVQACATRLQNGFSRVYQAFLLSSLKRKAEKKLMEFPGYFSLEELRSCRTLESFDDRITARLHGFKSADDYYTQSSSRQYLKRIAVPTLILHARDDPFMDPKVVPCNDELAASVRLEVSEYGGHVGFVSAGGSGRAEYWLERRVPEFLRTCLP
jgi:uncharacterized protein